MTDAQPASVYDLAHKEEAESAATFACLVDNEPGVLHRVVGLFAARGYNIESLTVAETDRNAHTSRITIVTRGTLQVLAQIEAQLQKMVSMRHVQDVSRDPNHEVALGFGPHFCLGAALARIEISAMLGALLDRFTALEPAGDVERTASFVIAGISRAPVTFR